MEFDFAQVSPRERYALLTAAVVPRPIALVTSINTAGVVNAAPFSFFNCMGSDPAIVVLGVGDQTPGVPKHTAANIRSTREFVVNVVVEEIADRMNLTATEFPEDISELDAVEFTAMPSVMVKPPRIAESPVHLECRELTTVAIGNNRMILGQVVQMHVRDELLNDRQRIIPGRLQAVGRMQSPSAYTRTRDQFDIARLSYAEFQSRIGSK